MSGEWGRFMTTVKGKHCTHLPKEQEKPENCGLLGLASFLGKVMDQILLKAVFKQVKVNKVIWNSQNAFPKGKLCLTNIIARYDEGAGAVNEGRAVDVVSLDLSKTFDVVSYCLLFAKLAGFWLKKW